MIRAFICILLVFLEYIPELSWAGAKKAPQPPAGGKKVIQLNQVQNVQIELPNGALHSFGQDLQASLTTRLFQTGKYILADYGVRSEESQRPFLSDSQSDQYVWSGTWVPSAIVSIDIKAVTFQTGSRGEKMFYGFDERFQNRYNDGSGREKNEFPLRLDSQETNWFGKSFDRKGLPPFDSRSGLDLGDGFNIDFLYAWLTVKYARYHAELRVLMKMQLPLSELSSLQTIAVKGEGFFFDVAGAYDQYSAGISFARTDAMSHALKNIISGSYETIDRILSTLPQWARIDAILPDRTILLGTGPYAEIQPGTLYVPTDQLGVEIAITSSGRNGSIATVIAGDFKRLQTGQVLRQVTRQELASLNTLATRQIVSRSVAQSEEQSDLQPDFRSDVQSVQLPTVNLPPVSLIGLVPGVGRAQAILKSVAELVLLPYRIARYFLYNQSYHSRADLGSSRSEGIEKENWARQIGLNRAPPMEEGSTVVAVLDSGVDYNHPALHPFLWMNPNPITDFKGYQDRYGWDFISNDARPYDDGYHGTQLASLVVRVAPKVKIMPVKLFNPWGITNSAAIYGGFLYAVDHGANVILCGWSTSVRSSAIEEGIAYARDHQVAVITAAGDGGVNLDIHPSYPASYVNQNDNLLVVTSSDSKKVNYGPQTVQISAPGVSILVAEPRSGWSHVSSSSLSAAIVAGALAREAAYFHSSGNYRDWMDDLIQGSDSLPALAPQVKQGLRLHIRR